MNYRVAIIGVGGMANLYAQALNEIDGISLLAGACRSQVKGEAFANRFNCHWYADYCELLDKERLDFALICTPSSVHLAPAEACASRGVNIICTKPLEVTTARCDRMIRATEHVMLAGLYPVRYTPAMRAVYQAVSEGRFGSISTINTYTPWWRDECYYSADRWQGTLEYDGGGSVINQSIHGIDMMQWLAAAAMPDLPKDINPVKHVCAFTSRRAHSGGHINVEDTAVAIVRFHNGALGQVLACTSMYPGSEKQVLISGRDGTAEVTEHRLSDFRFRNVKPQDQAIRIRLSKQAPTSGASDPLAISYRDEIPPLRDIFQAHNMGTPPPVSGLEARKAVAIIQAIYESAQLGIVVEIT